jgi:hypothetical protein
MAIIRWHMPELSGITGLFVFIRAVSDATLLNAGGDALVEDGTTGMFKATVAEAVAEISSVAAYVGAAESRTNIRRTGWLAVGGTLVLDLYPGYGDAEQATSQAVLDILEDRIAPKTDKIGSAGSITSLFAGAVLTPGSLVGFPSQLVIGDSYQQSDGQDIEVPLVDTAGNPLEVVGTRDIDDAAATFVIRRINETDPARVISGTATIVNPAGSATPAGTPYARIQISASETSKGLAQYRYCGILTLSWSGPGTSVKSFHSEEISFVF